MTLYLDVGISAMLRELWFARYSLSHLFFQSIWQVLQQVTGDLRTASLGLCGDHYNGEEWYVPVKTIHWYSSREHGHKCAWRLCQERRRAIIGDAHESSESTGDSKKKNKQVARLSNGAIKTTFTESGGGKLSSCRVANSRCACLVPLTKQSSGSFQPWI